MVGAGVLGLPAAFVFLGWAGGTILMLLSLLVSWYSFTLLVKVRPSAPLFLWRSLTATPESNMDVRGSDILNCYHLCY